MSLRSMRREEGKVPETGAHKRRYGIFSAYSDYIEHHKITAIQNGSLGKNKSLLLEKRELTVDRTLQAWRGGKLKLQTYENPLALA